MICHLKIHSYLKNRKKLKVKAVRFDGSKKLKHKNGGITIADMTIK